MIDKIVLYKDLILMTIGTLLIILSFMLITYDKIEYLKINIKDEIELQKYRENNQNNN